MFIKVLETLLYTIQNKIIVKCLAEVFSEGVGG